MNSWEIANKILAGIIAISFGILAGFITYCGLELLMEPLRTWITNKLGGVY